jgi:DNA-binding NarL/FixJ family response regulator
MTDTPSRVLLIDDHEMSRRGLEAMLSTAEWVEVVGEADGCEPGLAQIERLQPDIVLLDIRMPGLDGLQCLEEIKKLEHPVAVVIVTLYNDRRYVLEAIRRGAAGYVLKEASTGEILSTIAAVADGQLAVEPGLLREALMAPPDEPPAEETARARAESFALTPRELDVLRLLADGMTNKEIGGQLSIAEDTVKKHVQNIIWKLRAADRTQAAIVAYRAGLLDPLDA